jgi:hypothetical protein
MLAGPVALFGFKADKRRFIPLWCISIYLRSGNGDGPIVGTLVVHVSSSVQTDVNWSLRMLAFSRLPL